MSKQNWGADPVNVGDHGVISDIARHWLEKEGNADPEQVANALRIFCRVHANRPFQPAKVSEMLRKAVERGMFNHFIALVKFARLQRLIEV